MKQRTLAIERLRDWPVRPSNRFLVAGPCSVESKAQVLQSALDLAAYDVTVLRGGIWKPRTHPGSFEGVGIPGLAWLKRAGIEAGLPVTTEVANPCHVQECLKAGIDILWIGARTTTNPFAVQEIADALRGVNIPVMVKNPMNADLELWIGAIERIHNAGITKIMAVHRGFSIYRPSSYRNPPLWRIPIELRRRMPQLPLICDPSHICGSRARLTAIAQEAMDFLFDGLMIEVHCAPAMARSDAAQQLTPTQYGKLLRRLHYPSAADGTRRSSAVRALRKEIDAIDDDLIALLARRMECATKIGSWKRNHNVSLLQLERWEHVLHDRVQRSVKRRLSASFAHELFERIHEEALAVQEQIPAATDRNPGPPAPAGNAADELELPAPATILSCQN
jgi:chorismate mutase